MPILFLPSSSPHPHRIMCDDGRCSLVDMLWDVSQKASEQKRVGSLLNDREVRVEEEGLRTQRDGKKMEHMQKEIERLHRSLFHLTKEHMEFRQNMRSSARVAREMHESAIKERDESKKELQLVVRSMEDERRV
jgi:hypothetical protein